jgi:hypothetical protein
MFNQLKVVLVLLAVATGTAQAQSFVSVNSMFGKSPTGARDTGYVFVVGHRMNNVIVDASAETIIPDATKTSINRLEGGASFLLPTGTTITPYVRTALGIKTVGGNQFSYYSAEPGIRMTVGPGTARLGWRYRNAVDADQFNDNTRTWRAIYVLPVTKTVDLNFAYEAARGDANYNGVMTGFTVRF